MSYNAKSACGHWQAVRRFNTTSKVEILFSKVLCFVYKSALSLVFPWQFPKKLFFQDLTTSSSSISNLIRLKMTLRIPDHSTAQSPKSYMLASSVLRDHFLCGRRQYPLSRCQLELEVPNLVQPRCNSCRASRIRALQGIGLNQLLLHAKNLRLKSSCHHWSLISLLVSFIEVRDLPRTLTHFNLLLYIIQKRVIWFAAQIKWLVSI